MNYWLFKSEPDTFSVDALAQSPNQTTRWDGVRNYQVRNMLRDEVRSGDKAFFYHSSCAEPGIVGTMIVVSPAYPDPTAFDPSSPYFDPKSRTEAPRWYALDVKLESRLERPMTLAELRRHPELADMLVLRRGNRLSITPVAPRHWQYILRHCKK